MAKKKTNTFKIITPNFEGWGIEDIIKLDIKPLNPWQISQAITKMNSAANKRIRRMVESTIKGKTSSPLINKLLVEEGIDITKLKLNKKGHLTKKLQIFKSPKTHDFGTQINSFYQVKNFLKDKYSSQIETKTSIGLKKIGKMIDKSTNDSWSKSSSYTQYEFWKIYNKVASEVSLAEGESFKLQEITERLINSGKYSNENDLIQAIVDEFNNDYEKNNIFATEDEFYNI